jgi:uncharacterized protein
MRDRHERTCIVTRKAGSADELIRFVAAPDGSVVADLKRNLPGRGCWVSANRKTVELAISKNVFARALNEKVTAAEDLPDVIDRVMTKNFSGTLGLARKAGQIALGSAKVDSTIRKGEAILVLHATDGAVDGVRKLDQARKAVAMTGGPDIPALKLLTSDEMDLALGGGNVIHAAVLKGSAGINLAKKAFALARYRGLEHFSVLMEASDDEESAEKSLERRSDAIRLNSAL